MHIDGYNPIKVRIFDEIFLLKIPYFQLNAIFNEVNHEKIYEGEIFEVAFYGVGLSIDGVKCAINQKCYSSLDNTASIETQFFQFIDIYQNQRAELLCTYLKTGTESVKNILKNNEGYLLKKEPILSYILSEEFWNGKPLKEVGIKGIYANNKEYQSYREAIHLYNYYGIKSDRINENYYKNNNKNPYHKYPRLFVEPISKTRLKNNRMAPIFFKDGLNNLKFREQFIKKVTAYKSDEIRLSGAGKADIEKRKLKKKSAEKNYKELQDSLLIKLVIDQINILHKGE